jgi:WD40 repeat protein
LKGTRTVLRGGGGGNATSLPDRHDIENKRSNHGDKMKKIFIVLFIMFTLVSCSITQSSQSVIQEVKHTTEIIETEMLSPTFTSTPIPPTATTTQTPSLTPTPTPKPITGYLPDGALRNLGRGQIYDIEVSPDGTQILIGSVGGFYVWDGNDYHEIIFIPIKTINYSVSSIDFSPDGSYLVVSTRTDLRNSDDHMIYLYDTEDFKLIDQVAIPTKHRSRPKAIFSPKEPIIAILSEGKINTWNYENGEWNFIYRAPGDTYIFDIAFVPNGQLIVSNSNRALILELDDVQITKRYQTQFQPDDSIRYIAVSHDGNLAAAYSLNRLIVWEIESGEVLTEVEELDIPQLKYSDLYFSSDDKFVYLGYRAGVFSWNIENGNQSRVLNGQTSGRSPFYMQSTLLPNERLIASSTDEQITIWDLESGQIIYTSSAFSPAATTGTFSPDGSDFAISVVPGYDGNSVRVYDADNGRLENILFPPSESIAWNIHYSSKGNYLYANHIYSLQNNQVVCSDFGILPSVIFSPDEKEFAFEFQDGFIVFDLSNCSHIRTISRVSDSSEFSVTADWKYVLEGTENGVINVYQMDSGELVTKMPVFSSPVDDILVSDDGRYIAADDKTKTLVLNLETGDVVATMYSSLVFSGKYITENRVVTHDSIWDIEMDENILSLKTVDLPAYRNIRISPDGQLLAAGGGSCAYVSNKPNCEIKINVIEIDSGELLYSYKGHSNPTFLSLTFSPNSQQLASMSRDGSVILWDTSH